MFWLFVPPEHRNMPLDDAIVLIARNFEAYMLELREKATATVVAPAPAPKKDFVPPDQHTVYLLNLLADSRFLTVDELDRVISYLQTRRHQLAEGTPKAPGWFHFLLYVLHQMRRTREVFA